MKKFRQKIYTIQEGHYTGPKDLEKVPGTFEVLGKTTLGGAAIGGTVGGILGKTEVIKDTGILDGATKGGKAGFLAGVAAKLLLNALHKPMKKVEYQEVDKMLRAKFGIYRMSGFTFGDSMAKRKSVEEKFGFNDRNVTDYKISFVIRDNLVTMYTLGVTEEELDKLNKSLDYYCKKFSGMSYSSKPINVRTRSYSVSITFTNYKAISDFIFEVSEETGLKINLLNTGALIERAAIEEESREEEEEKSYSAYLDKYDIARLVPKSVAKALNVSLSGPRERLSTFMVGMMVDGFKKLRDQELAKFFPSARKNFGSSYLTDRLKALGGVIGMNYTIGEKATESNIRLDRGVFIVTTLLNSRSDKFWNSVLPHESRKEVNGKVALWAVPIQDRRSFDIILEKALHSGTKPNVYK